MTDLTPEQVKEAKRVIARAKMQKAREAKERRASAKASASTQAATSTAAPTTSAPATETRADRAITSNVCMDISPEDARLARWSGLWREALARTVSDTGNKVGAPGDFYDKLSLVAQVYFLLDDAMASGRFDPAQFPWPSWEALTGLNKHGNPLKPDQVAAMRRSAGEREAAQATARVLDAAEAPFRPTPAPAVVPQPARAPVAVAASASPMTSRPSREAILGHVTGGVPSVPVGEPIRHALA